jgi:penicillin amidase
VRRVAVLGAALAVMCPSAAWAADVPPPMQLRVESALPAGESGHWSLTGQAAYAVTNDPSAFGPHADDQRELYWRFKGKSGAFTGEAGQEGATVTPKPGVSIHRDAAGVPSVYASTGRDVWFGVGYAAGVDRLFEADAIRRTALGTLAELTGPSQVPKDIAQRTIGYTDAELRSFLDSLSPQARDAIEGYAAGLDARITEVRADPTLLPAEHVLLSSIPEPWSVRDTLAVGVYLTRFVAAQGGEEWANVRALRDLEAKLGVAAGRKAFNDLLPADDPQAVTAIHDRAFSNVDPADRNPAAREAAFAKAAAFADSLPMELATGQGTGAAPVPAVPAAAPAADLTVARAQESVAAWAASLHGGSWAMAVAPDRTRDGHALLISAPQLDYSYPSLLWELEVHGAGYDARGVGVPGAPTVAIGWTGSVAWGLTTGYSKTIDSFIETTRVQSGTPQWLHDGVWKDQQCRTETVRYRVAQQGVPVAPPLLSKDYQVCRTGHGPVVATTGDGSRARTVQYAMWKHEIDTIEGILQWNRAKTLADFAAGVAKVSWNENAVAVSTDGHIGYWHPGRYLRRPAGVDQRFPTPGTGAFDATGLVPFAEMPHVVDPAEGFVASWNTKPARGWVDGDLSGSVTRPAGPANRVAVIQSLLASRTDWSFADLQQLDARIGSADMEAQGFRPLLEQLAGSSLSSAQRAAVDLMLGWDGRAYAPGEGSSPLGTPAAQVTDGPAATLHRAWTSAIVDEVAKDVPASIATRLRTLPTESHQYDVSPLHNFALRVLRTGFSGITPSRDWTGGRTPVQVTRAALDAAVAALTSTYGSDPSRWHRPHAVSNLRSLSRAVGPDKVQMPFQDRGSWVHRAGMLGPDRRSHRATSVTPVTRRPAAPAGTLAATGGSLLPSFVAALLLASGWRVRCWRRAAAAR